MAVQACNGLRLGVLFCLISGCTSSTDEAAAARLTYNRVREAAWGTTALGRIVVSIERLEHQRDQLREQSVRYEAMSRRPVRGFDLGMGFMRDEASNAGNFAVADAFKQRAIRVSRQINELNEAREAAVLREAKHLMTPDEKRLVEKLFPEWKIALLQNATL